MLINWVCFLKKENKNKTKRYLMICSFGVVEISSLGTVCRVGFVSVRSSSCYHDKQFIQARFQKLEYFSLPRVNLICSYSILLLFYWFLILFGQFRLLSEVLGRSRNPRWWIQDGSHFFKKTYDFTSYNVIISCCVITEPNFGRG